MRHLVLGLIAVGAVAAGALVIDIQTGKVSALIDEFGISMPQMSGGGKRAELASKGDAESQFELGQMYYQGVGASKDYEHAAAAFFEAAKQGHRRAQYNLGVMYSKGLGVEKDLNEAYVWFYLAASKGYAKAVKPLKKLEGVLTAKQKEGASATQIKGALTATEIILAREKAKKFRKNS